MNLIEKRATEAMQHLQLARNEMKKLLYASEDRINEIVVDDSFKELENHCREILKCRYGIGARTTAENRDLRF
jgi:hypothetical protein